MYHRRACPIPEVATFRIGRACPWPDFTAKTQYFHYNDVEMTTIASQITSLMVVYSTVYSDAHQRKHQSSASLAFVWGIHRERWDPRTKGQLRGKCFHLMTSSGIHHTQNVTHINDNLIHLIWFCKLVCASKQIISPLVTLKVTGTVQTFKARINNNKNDIISSDMKNHKDIRYIFQSRTIFAAAMLYLS